MAIIIKLHQSKQTLMNESIFLRNKHINITNKMKKLQLPGKAIILLGEIATYISRDLCYYASYPYIAEDYGISVRQAKRYIKILSKKNFITVVHNKKGSKYYNGKLPLNKSMVVSFSVSKICDPKDIMKNVPKNHYKNTSVRIKKSLANAKNKKKSDNVNKSKTKAKTKAKTDLPPHTIKYRFKHLTDQDNKFIVQTSDNLSLYFQKHHIYQYFHGYNEYKRFRSGYFVKAFKEHAENYDLTPSKLPYIYDWVISNVQMPNIKKQVLATGCVPIQVSGEIKLHVGDTITDFMNNLFPLIFKESEKSSTDIKADAKKARQNLQNMIKERLARVIPEYVNDYPSPDDYLALNGEPSDSNEAPSPDGQDRTDKPNNSSNDKPKDAHEPKSTDKPKGKDDGKLDKKKNDDKINHQKDKNKQNNNNDDDNDNGKKHSPSATSSGLYIDKNGYYHCPF